MNKNTIYALQHEFLEKFKNKSFNTLNNYKNDLACFNNFFKSDLLKEFAYQQALDYCTFLMNRHPASSNSRRRRIQTVRAFFDFLMQKKIFNENPFLRINSAPKKLNTPSPTPLGDIHKLWLKLNLQRSSKDEFESIVALRNLVIFLLIYGGALKISTISKLKKEHIFLSPSPRILISPKKREPYSVPIPEIFTQIYLAYQQALNEHRLTQIFFYANIFQIVSEGLSERGIEIIFQDFKKIGVSTTPRAIRQAAIYKWLHQNHHQSKIKEWLGVSPAYSLSVYTTTQDKFIYGDQFLNTFI